MVVFMVLIKSGMCGLGDVAGDICCMPTLVSVNGFENQPREGKQGSESWVFSWAAYRNVKLMEYNWAFELRRTPWPKSVQGLGRRPSLKSISLFFFFWY